MRLTEIIETKSGKIRGYIDEGVEIYKGIPYAEAPVGDLRFREPHPKEPWDNVKDCIKFGAIAPQNQPDDPKIDLPEEEDCLYLNIWTPGADDKKRPVMVWIHGGGFLIGSGSRPRSDGTRLASYGDVVVVSFNYRIGVLGFLNFPGIPANLGIRDQVAALKWIKENIEDFGGNPNNITIFGESAGGQSVTILLAIPSAENLFHKAIVQSGNANPRDFKPKRSREGANELLRKLNINGENLDELRKISLEKLIRLQRKIAGNILSVKDSPFWPFIDGEFLPKQPIEIFREGNNNQIPIIIGYNENELGFLSELLKNAGGLKRNLILKYVHSNIRKSGINKKDLDKLISTYSEKFKKDFPNNPFLFWDAILSDSMFKIPIIRQLEAQIHNQSRIYCYEFSYKSPKFKFALHTFEIPFVFDTLDKNDVAEGAIEVNEDSKKLTKIIMDTWISFARKGNPDNERIPSWHSYDLETRAIMKLSINPKVMETKENTLFKIWEGIL
ncbi:MAG: carboxylesterase/lipase family protein [Promethearchaeota archaeon]